MSKRKSQLGRLSTIATLLAFAATAQAQVPVDADGNPVGEYQSVTGEEAEELALLSAIELEELIGPIALYPDDLLAIILPASTFPLQIVEAARFLENLEADSSLEPDEDWDDAVVALTNYPEVVEKLNEDLDWTWRLGEAVVAQQPEVIKAIEAFRDRAYAAGNLKSDAFQEVSRDEGALKITPAEEEVIYVPYYEPEEVIVYQPRRVYYYYPRPYPVYYYPYPAGYAFPYRHFWGVTTAFSIGWYSHHLRVWHHSYYGHPFYGRSYWYDWWYRRPDIHIHNRYYVRNRYNVSYDRYGRGDYWQPRTRRTIRGSDQRLTRTRYYPGANSRSGSAATIARSTRATRSDGSQRVPNATQRRSERTPIAFRERTGTPSVARNNAPTRTSNVRPATSNREPASLRSRTSRNSVNRPSTQYRQPTSRSGSLSRAPAQSRASTSRSSAPRPAVSRSSSQRPTASRSSSQRPSASRSSSQRPSASRSSSPQKSGSQASRSSKSSSNNSSRRASSRSSDRRR